GEHAFPVPPLALPHTPTNVTAEYIGRSPAVRLFVDRAKAVHPGFTLTNTNAADIALICRRLDGVPLALELAAARARHMSVRELAERIAGVTPSALGVLTGGPRDAPVRQRTMRNAIAWSYELLTEVEQTILRRAAVFAGGFTREAAMPVVADLSDSDIEEGINALVDHSLLRAVARDTGSSRYTMLETLREYGLEQLSARGELQETQRRHVAWCVDRVRWQWNQLLDEELPPNAWLAWADTEQDNVRAALVWSLEAGEVEAATWLAGAFHWFWEYRGLFREGLRWLEQALAGQEDIPPMAHAWAIEGKGVLSGLLGDWKLGIQCLEECVALNRTLDDERGVARGLLNLGIRLIDYGDYNRAAAALNESMELYRSLGSNWGFALAEAHLGTAHYGKHELGAAAEHLWAALNLAREVNDPLARFVAPLFLGLVACEKRQPAAAARWFQEVLAFYAEDNGLVVAWQRDPDGAARIVASVAILAGLSEQPSLAARLLGAAKRPQEEIGLAFALPEQAAFTRLEAEVRAALGNDEFKMEWSAGYHSPPADVAAEVASVIVTALETGQADDISVSEAPFSLTEREREVLTLIAAGRTDREIGEALFISHRTVNKHVGNVLAKLGVDSRVEAASHAVRYGLV
ncbi:MAG: LuxR C-terminal-related transcriptional regulator, partial [Chloroflexota bacterium]|nr:LuxR C-terminal-related transcriptional regulator [Chloroflexota bacterium]